MKKYLIIGLLLSLSNIANATCIGSSSYSHCYDNNGNSYDVMRMGNMTTTNGYNSNTGSSWSQTSQTYGNTTYQNGYDSNGNSWNQTIQSYGNGMTNYSGTDSDGNYFNKTCLNGQCY